MLRRVVGDDPVVGSLLVLGRAVPDGRPEERLALRRRPHALVDLVADVRVLRQPLDHRRTVQRT